MTEENNEENKNLVKEAEETVKRLEEANKKKEELLDREEKLKVKDVLGGSSDAGSVPEKPKELTAEEYAEKIDKGEANPLKDDGYI